MSNLMYKLTTKCCNSCDDVCKEAAATLAAHEATIKKLRATNIEQAKAIGDQVATIADRNELIAHLQERLDA